MDEHLATEFESAFDLSHFFTFIKDHNIVATSVAALLSERVNEITATFVDHLVIPVINRDVDGDGVRDVKKLEDIEFKAYGANFKIGKVILAFFKFVIITYIIFLIAKTVKYATSSLAK